MSITTQESPNSFDADQFFCAHLPATKMKESQAHACISCRSQGSGRSRIFPTPKVDVKNYYYCLQTKFVKVMFSQVFVCPQGGLCLGRVSVQGVFWGVSAQGSLCWGVHGVCLFRGFSVQGVSVQGHLCQGDLRMVTYDQYTSYWNLFSFGQFFPQKLHEIERIWTLRRTCIPDTPLDPPL